MWINKFSHDFYCYLRFSLLGVKYKGRCGYRHFVDRDREVDESGVITLPRCARGAMETVCISRRCTDDQGYCQGTENEKG